VSVERLGGIYAQQAPSGLKTGLGSAADGLAVREQVAKPVLQGVAFQHCGPQASRQREGQRAELAGAKPGLVVAELLGAPSPFGRLDRALPGPHHQLKIEGSQHQQQALHGEPPRLPLQLGQPRLAAAAPPLSTTPSRARARITCSPATLPHSISQSTHSNRILNEWR
jgi:hypothetical protein